MSWIVGDGQTIRLWKDPWLPHGSLCSYIEGPLLPHDEDCQVHSLWTNKTWSFEALNIPLPAQLQNLIQGIPVPQYAQLTDTFLWPHNNGTCSVKSASKFLFHQHHAPWNKPLWNWIWALTCPQKIQIFLWKAMRNRLPTKQFLAFGRPHVDTHCPRCHTSETTIHILRDCLWTKEIWQQCPRILPLNFFRMLLQDWSRYNATTTIVILPHQIPWHVYFPFTCWNIWLAHNGRIFRDQSRS